jgi:hypothetical protein
MNRIRSLAVVAAALVVALVATLSAAQGAVARTRVTLRFAFVPQQTYQGKSASITVLVKPAGVRCGLGVKYSNGASQAGLGRVRAALGRAQWTWDLALTAPVGPAVASVSCAGSHAIRRRFTVVGGTVRPSKLEIVTSGWSQRPDRVGPGSNVSYGVQLNNPSDAKDAQGVTALVNFLDGAGTVLQSATTQIPAVGESSIFNLGGYVHLPNQTPVGRLEIVLQTSAWVAHALHQPAIENIHIVPSQFEPTWVGSVDGDLINDHPTSTLTNAQLSIVVFDSSGKVVGGGTGYLFAALPPGTRAFFSATSGLSSIPVTSASTAVISIEPTYKAPGA